MRTQFEIDPDAPKPDQDRAAQLLSSLGSSGMERRLLARDLPEGIVAISDGDEIRREDLLREK